MNPELKKILDTISDKNTREKAIALFEVLVKGTKNFDDAIEVVNTRFGRGVDTVNELRNAIQASSETLRGTTSEIVTQKKVYRDISKVLDGILYRTSGIEKGTLKQLEKDKLIAERAKERLKATGEFDEVIQETIDRLDEEIKFQERVNDTIGLTGAAFDNLNRIGQRAFGGLGINLGTLEESFKDVSQAIREQGELIAANAEEGEELGTLTNRFKTFGAALKPLGKGLKDVFTDPVILLKGITDAFFEIDKAATSLANNTGQSFKGNLSLATSTFNRFATAVDLAEVITEETKQSGLNANNIFSPEVLAGAAEFKNLIGGSANEISGLLTLTAATGMNTDLIQESIVDTTSAFNGANRAAVSQRAILGDVLTAANGVKASLAGNPKALAEAAASARRLGLSLQEVDQIASSLLDFESSINNELEAQLLTGRSLNLSKARELALNNDLAGLSEEIFKNQVSVAEFSQMNRIQQEGLAKALGVNRDQLANMAFTQAKMNGLTDEAAAAAAGVELSDMQRVEAIEAIKNSLTSLIQILAPVLDFFSYILGSIAKFPGLVKSVLLLGIAFKTLGNPLTGAAKGINSILTGAGKLTSTFKKIQSTGFLKFLKNGASAAKDYGKKLSDIAKFGGENLKKAPKVLSNKQLLAGFGGKDAMESAKASAPNLGNDTGKKVSKTLKDTQDVKPKEGLGKKIEEFFTGLSNGLKQMASLEVLKGALNLIPASIGLIAMIPGSAGAFLVSKINGPGLAAGLTGLATGLVLMGNVAVAKGALFLSLAALSFIALLPALPGMALLGIVGPLASTGLTALASGLGIFGTVAAPAIPILLSIAAVAAGIGVAFAGIGAVFAGIGVAFAGMGFGIKMVAEGIVLLTESLTMDKIKTLLAASYAILSLSSALGAFALAGVLALPALLLVTPLLKTLNPAGDAGEAEGQNTMSKVEEKLDMLIAAVKEDRKIYINGRVLEEVMVQGTTR